MKTRREIIEESYSQWKDTVVDLDYHIKSKGEYIQSLPENIKWSSKNFFKDSQYKEVLEIYDSYELTRYVIIEKVDKCRKNLDDPFSKKNRQRYYKSIKKVGDDKVVTVTRVDSYTTRDYISDFNSLQKELELKKYNVFYDGNDIEQTIKYYSNFKNVEF